MSTGRAPPPTSVPTLTEVVSWPDDDASTQPGTARADTSVPSPSPSPPLGPVPVPVPVPAPVQSAPATPVPLPMPTESDAEVAGRLLAQIQQQLDLAIDVRLREALTPVLARAADALVRDARREMASVLRDIVARAVDAELARRRGP